MSEKVKPGYKQTDVGVIPEEWEKMRLADLAEVTSSKRIFENDYVPFGIPFYRGKEISLLIEGQPIDDAFYITEEKFAEIKNRFGAPIRGDILITAVGTLGNVFIVNTDAPFYFKDGNLIWLRNIRRTDPTFLGIQLRRARTTILNGAIGSSQKALTIVVLKDLEIALPPAPEQRAIAEALSDVDALIGVLDQLIAKKRDLKQAAMQQLLTGQTRLPGFHGEWEVVKADDIGRFRGGSGFPTKCQGATTGEYPFFKVSDMNNAGNETDMVTANNYISEALRKQLGAIAFPAESIIFAKVGAAVFLERKKILRKASCLDNNMAAFVLDANRAYYRFIHYVLLNTNLGKLVSTTALPSLSGSVLSAIEMRLPPIPEQIAIAEVLSDMGVELTALEQRRDKTRAIKQGMMQELLTGRTRLV